MTMYCTSALGPVPNAGAGVSPAWLKGCGSSRSGLAADAEQALDDRAADLATQIDDTTTVGDDLAAQVARARAMAAVPDGAAMQAALVVVCCARHLVRVCLGQRMAHGVQVVLADADAGGFARS